MKGQISRFSYRQPPQAGYSGVYLQQGRMVTDADQIESTEIHKARVNALGADAIASGSPEAGGIVDLDGAQPTRLRPGTVYVDGIRAEVRAGPGAAPPGAGPLALYAAQADFPGAPAPEEMRAALGGAERALVYVDLWERSVYPGMTPELVDPALQGADTAFRTRTLAQIRLAAADAPLGEDAGPYPTHGTARLAADLHEAVAAEDPCDPCASEIDLPVTTGNMLFRLEVLQVSGPADAPDAVTLAWSAENASELHARAAALDPEADVAPPDFLRDDRVYEVLTETTEAHLGAFAVPGLREESTLIAGGDLSGPGNPGEYLRRWDGAVTWTPAGDGLAIKPERTGDRVAVDGDTLVLTLDTLKLTLRVRRDGGTTQSFLPGDYWYVLVRAFAPEDDRVQVIGGTPNASGARPLGVRHHYLPLFTLAFDGDGRPRPEPVDDTQRRRLSFPALSDLPASHVAFEDPCPDLFHGAQTVQEALAKLCDLKASDVGFAPKDACAHVYGERGQVSTVADALNAICELDTNPEIFRYLVNCGVLCGLDVRCHPEKPGAVQVMPGAFHDGAGHVHRIAQPVAVEALAQMRPDGRLLDDSFILAVHAQPGGEPEYRLIPENSAEDKRLFKPEADLSDRLKSCAEIAGTPERVRRSLDLSGDLDAYVAQTYEIAIQGAPPPYPRERRRHDALARYYADLSTVELAFPATCADIEMPAFPDYPGDEADRTQPYRIAVAEAFAAAQNRIRRAERDCKCAAAVVPCPEEKPCWVRLAKIALDRDLKLDICLLCARDTALTMPALGYWFGSVFDALKMFAGRYLCRFSPVNVKVDDTAQAGAVYLDGGGVGLHSPDLVKDAFGGMATLRNPGTGENAVTDVRGMSVDRALGIYSADGVTVDPDQVFDLDRLEPGQLPAPAKDMPPELSTKFAGFVEPGDRVALLVSDGKVEAVRVLDKPSLRAAPRAGRGDRVQPGGLDVSEYQLREVLDEAVRRRMPEVESNFDAVRDEADALAARRREIASEVGRLRGEMADLQQGRARLVESVQSLEARERTARREVEEAHARVSEIRETLGAAQREAERARAEAERAQSDLEDSLRAIRAEQPVATLTRRSEVAGGLAEMGIETAGDLARLSPQRWGRIRRRLELDGNAAQSLMTRARKLAGRGR
jgi:hypothetical protein